MVETYGPADALGLVGSTIEQVRFDACVDAGGFGLIYRGFHEGLGETVAIKCLRIASIQQTNEEMREALAGRFRDETKLLYRLSQGNLDIVRCIGSSTLVAPKTREYTPYMVLEWLDGCTLSAELKERRDHHFGARSLEAAVNLLDSAAGALAYAHTLDVVHRDVKPGNLFLTRTRKGVRMKVLDFGLAKILGGEAIGIRPSVETGIGVHFCSPSYGAPEQYSAQIGKIGPWTDVYSLCLVLYEVMLGEKVRPAGSLAEGLLKALDPATGSPSASDLGLSVPRAVAEVLKRALAQDPLERPHDAGVFWALLKEAMTASPKRDMGATVMDDGVNTAMQHVRDAAALRTAAAQPPPLAGTMRMHEAPTGAPQAQSEGSAGGTSPLAPPMRSRSPGRDPESMHLARARGDDLKMTLPLRSTSPLAASMAAQSPLGNPSASGPPPPYAGQSGPPPNYGQPPQPRAMSSYPPGSPPHPDPRLHAEVRRAAPAAAPKKSSGGSLIAILVLVVLAVMGGAFYWLRLRGH